MYKEREKPAEGGGRGGLIGQTVLYTTALLYSESFTMGIRYRTFVDPMHSLVCGFRYTPVPSGLLRLI